MPISCISVSALQNNQLYCSTMGHVGDNDALKEYLLQALVPMNRNRIDWGWFNSAEKKAKFSAEKVLITQLGTSTSPDKTIEAMNDYHARFDEFPGMKPKGNTWEFLRQTAHLCTRDLSETPKKAVPKKVTVNIKQKMKQLDYRPNKRGMCYGMAWVGATACVRRDGLAYMRRMDFLARTNKSSLKASAMRGDHRELPFFDAVTLAMGNYKTMDGYAKGIGYPGQQSIEFPGKVLGGDEDDYCVPSVKDSFVASFTNKEFLVYLNQLKAQNEGKAFSVMVSCLGHAISIGFDGSKWLGVNHDAQIYVDKLDEQAISLLLDMHNIFRVQVVANEKCQLFGHVRQREKISGHA